MRGVPVRGPAVIREFTKESFVGYLTERGLTRLEALAVWADRPSNTLNTDALDRAIAQTIPLAKILRR